MRTPREVAVEFGREDLEGVPLGDEAGAGDERLELLVTVPRQAISSFSGPQRGTNRRLLVRRSTLPSSSGVSIVERGSLSQRKSRSHSACSPSKLSAASAKAASRRPSLRALLTTFMRRAVLRGALRSFIPYIRKSVVWGQGG